MEKFESRNWKPKEETDFYRIALQRTRRAEKRAFFTTDDAEDTDGRRIKIKKQKSRNLTSETY